MTRRLKIGGFMKSLSLVDKKNKVKKQKVDTRFDSGSEKESRHDSDHFKEDVSEKSDDSKVSVDLSFKPTILLEQADLISKQMREHGSSSSINRKSAIVQTLDTPAVLLVDEKGIFKHKANV